MGSSHNIPPEFISRENAIIIGNKVGKFIDVDFNGNGLINWIKCLRIKVEISVLKPLLARFYISRKTSGKL